MGRGLVRNPCIDLDSRGESLFDLARMVAPPTAVVIIGIIDVVFASLFIMYGQLGGFSVGIIVRNPFFNFDLDGFAIALFHFDEIAPPQVAQNMAHSRRIGLVAAVFITEYGSADFLTGLVPNTHNPITSDDAKTIERVFLKSLFIS